VNPLLFGQSLRWNRALEQLRSIDNDPEEEAIRFFQSSFLKRGSHGLDIGCGFGRHTLLAAQLGFRMTAVDFSRKAVEMTRNALGNVGYQIDVSLASMNALPFSDGIFDFSFAWCVFNHATQSLFEEAIEEAIRILRPNGICLGFVMSKNDPRYGSGIRVERDCFVFMSGIETGIYHYFPTEHNIKNILEALSFIEVFREIRYETNDVAAYHPGVYRSQHFLFVVRKKGL
jgi:SAM-dependent methyltransferase